ncbi:MAG: hypothetical protein HY906_04305 [Deltaproteobacteria bacterium]|nr:hypothetical protein [Deltaproteobacteria bacterium]
MRRHSASVVSLAAAWLAVVQPAVAAPAPAPASAPTPEGMLLVPAGTFTMGADSGGEEDEHPAHGLRATNRVHHPGGFRIPMLGFRCARDTGP